MGMLKQLLAEDSGTKFMSELKWLVVILMSIAGSLCILYAIYIGYLFATATDEGKRRAAKNRLFKVISSGLILVALAFCLNVIDLKFETPNNGESSNGGDDPLANIDPTGSAFFYDLKGVVTDDGKKLWITTNESDHYVQLSSQYLTMNGEKIDQSKFGGFEEFSLVQATGSLQNVFGSLENEDNPTQGAGSKTLKYYYRAQPSDNGDRLIIRYIDIKGVTGKYWRGSIRFKYEGKSVYADCYIQVDDGHGTTFGTVLEKVTL